jgi:YD repeat-containing protein
MKLGDGVGREPAPDVATYTYAGMGYADPDAVTQIANGLSTTTFQYDNNGNVIQKTTDGTTTTYIYDYANRLTATAPAVQQRLTDTIGQATVSFRPAQRRPISIPSSGTR